MYCTATDCSHPTTHNIWSHMCRRCHKYNHSCSGSAGVTNIPTHNQCKIKGCEHRHTHTSDGHQRRICGRYGHGFRDCTTDLSVANISQLISRTSQRFYVVVYIGMGHYRFYRNTDGNLESFDMSPLKWGQYPDPDMDDTPRLKRFLQGYQPLRTHDIIELD